MKYQINTLVAITLLINIVIFNSCKKDWLDIKPEKSLVVPTTIKDFQALLDNTTLIFNSQAGGAGEMSAGDFFLLNASYSSLFSSEEKSAFIWSNTENFYNGEPSADWAGAYKRILNANIILEGLDKISPSQTELLSWNNAKGSALFFRAFDYYSLSQQYCKPYLEATASSDLGIPIRTEPNVNIPVGRGNLQQTYAQIIDDLRKSISLLPIEPSIKTRPSKHAAYSMLSRIYLSMESYDQAFLYADSALQVRNTLMNFSALNAAATYPIARFNTEVIFQSTFSYGIFAASRLLVDPLLFSSYAPNDLRRTVYFTNASGGMTYKGSYNGDKNLFGGLTIDELYLTRAECYARKGNKDDALKDLNFLLRTRWSGTFQDITATTPDDALGKILTERRKELIFRGVRWSDLRRLNRDSRFRSTLTRTVNGQTYTLAPEDSRYVLPIDETEIRLSGIQQNIR